MGSHKQQPGSTHLFPTSLCCDMMTGLHLVLTPLQKQALNPVATQVLHIKRTPYLTALLVRKCYQAWTRSKFASRVGPLVLAFLLVGSIAEEQRCLYRKAASLKRCWSGSYNSLKHGHWQNNSLQPFAMVGGHSLAPSNGLSSQSVFIMFSHNDQGHSYRLYYNLNKHG